MRKFALLFAFVLVMALTGSAFAANGVITVDDLNVSKNGRGTVAITEIRKVDNGGTLTINVSPTNPIDQVSASDFQWIHKIMTDPTIEPTIALGLGATDTFVMILDTYQTEIQDGSFENYERMATLTAGTNKIAKIGANAFKNTKNIVAAGLDSILLNNTALVSIGNDAFKDSKYVGTSGVTISSTVFTTLGAGAFAGSKITAFTVTTPSLKAIPADAFNGCDALVTVTMTSSEIASIGERAFSGCEDGLLTVLFSPETKTIGEKAFFECKKLSTVTIPANSKLEKIGASAFEHCIDLATLDFQDATKLTTIEEGAFRGCITLDTLSDTYKTKIDTIGEYAFVDTKINTNIQGFPTTLRNIGKGAFGHSDYSATGRALQIVFRSGTDKTEDKELKTAAALRAFLETLSIGGAFASDQWPIGKITADTIKIGFAPSGTPTDMYAILNQAQGIGGIIDDSNNADTRAIVGILKGAGFSNVNIYVMLGDTVNSKFLLSEETIAAIPAINAPSSIVTREDLESALSSAKTKYEDPNNKVGTAVGDFRTQKELDDAVNALKTEYNKANAVYLDTSATSAQIKTAYDTLNVAISAFNAAKIQSVPPPVKSDDYRGGGSTGGSGGCAAGFAPMAALFVLGAALKLRKGR